MKAPGKDTPAVTRPGVAGVRGGVAEGQRQLAKQCGPGGWARADLRGSQVGGKASGGSGTGERLGWVSRKVTLGAAGKQPVKISEKVGR